MQNNELSSKNHVELENNSSIPSLFPNFLFCPQGYPDENISAIVTHAGDTLLRGSSTLHCPRDPHRTSLKKEKPPKSHFMSSSGPPTWHEDSFIFQE
jgi:hypothetical protein